MLYFTTTHKSKTPTDRPLSFRTISSSYYLSKLTGYFTNEQINAYNLTIKSQRHMNMTIDTIFQFHIKEPYDSSAIVLISISPLAIFKQNVSLQSLSNIQSKRLSVKSNI